MTKAPQPSRFGHLSIRISFIIRDSCMVIFKCLAIRLVNIVTPENEDHLLDIFVVREKFSRGFYSNQCRLLDRIAISAATDRRKRNRRDSVFHCDVQRIAITVCQRLSLAIFSAPPDRPDGVNDKPSGQTIATSNFCFTRPTTS